MKCNTDGCENEALRRPVLLLRPTQANDKRENTIAAGLDVAYCPWCTKTLKLADFLDDEMWSTTIAALKISAPHVSKRKRKRTTLEWRKL